MFSYAPPLIVAEPDYEVMLSERVASFLSAWAAFQQRFPNAGLPNFNVETLEYDPAIIALEAAATGDLHFRALLNDVARATILTDFARDEDLDLLGGETRVPGFPDGVLRHPGESNDVYAARIREARTGVSAAGPDEWWLAQARAADPRVRSIGLDYRGMGRLDVYLLSKEDGGVPDGAMLAAVTARLTQPDVRPRNVQIAVHSAIIDQIAVTADIWLAPAAAESRLDEIETRAIAVHNAAQALDVDLTHHYLTRLLDAEDVYDITVTAPAADLIADPSRAYALASVDLSLKGRAR